MRLRSFFRYYGSRHTAAPDYPFPIHGCVIEPFAGSASYATYHHKKDIILNELNTDIYLLWRWLITEATKGDILELPFDLEKGSDIRDLDVPYPAQVLIRLWQRIGAGNTCWTVSARNNRPKGDMWSIRTRNRIASQLTYIRHWRVTNLSYENVVHDIPSTWFVDSPYSSQPHRYGCPLLDYPALGLWCENLSGQILVCESEGADWLPFKHHHHVLVNNITNGRRPKRSDVVWVNDPEYMKKLDRKPIVMGNVFDMK